MTPPLLDIAGMTSGYGAAPHVRISSLSVNSGETAALVGPNGAGKTAVLRAILGLNPARADRLLFAGQALAPLPPERRARLGLAYVPQGRRLFPGMTVSDNLHVAARAPARVRAARIATIFAALPQLAGQRHQRAWRLSGGQQQMLAIARALMSDPRLILLDEPTLGLAPKVIDEVYAVLATIAQAGTALLITEQNRHRLPGFCTTVLPIADGAIVVPA